MVDTLEDVTRKLQDGVLKNARNGKENRQGPDLAAKSNGDGTGNGSGQRQEENERQIQEANELLTIEQQAANKGWREGGPKSAEEFLRAEPLYDELKVRGKEIKELKATLDELKAHMNRQQASESDRLRTAVTQARLDAIQKGDVKAVDAADKQLQQFAPIKPQLDTHVQSFLDRNNAWLKDPSYEGQQMRNFAQQRDKELISFKLSAEEQVRVIDKDLRTKFPHRFDDTGGTSQSVESDASPAMSQKVSGKHTFDSLSPAQKIAARHFEKRGVMTKEKYIQSLVQHGDL